VTLGIAEGVVCAVPPDRGRRFPKSGRVIPPWHVTSKCFVHPEFCQQDVARKPCLRGPRQSADLLVSRGCQRTQLNDDLFSLSCGPERKRHPAGGDGIHDEGRWENLAVERDRQMLIVGFTGHIAERAARTFHRGGHEA